MVVIDIGYYYNEPIPFKIISIFALLKISFQDYV